MATYHLEVLNYFCIWSPAEDARDYKRTIHERLHSDTTGHQNEVGRQTDGSGVVKWPDRYGGGGHLLQQKEIFVSLVIRKGWFDFQARAASFPS